MFASSHPLARDSPMLIFVLTQVNPGENAEVFCTVAYDPPPNHGTIFIKVSTLPVFTATNLIVAALRTDTLRTLSI